MAGIGIDDFDSIREAVKFAGGTYWVTNFYHTIGHEKNITSKIVEKAHAIGIKVVVWTPDCRLDMKGFIKKGVDGIITNRPDRLLSLLVFNSNHAFHLYLG